MNQDDLTEALSRYLDNPNMDDLDKWYQLNNAFLNQHPARIWYCYKGVDDFVQGLLTNTSDPNSSIVERLFISTNPQLDVEDFKFKSSHLLYSYQSVPKLYAFLAKKDLNNNFDDYSALPSSFAHYGFLVRALSKIANAVVGGRFIREVMQFILQNKNKIDQLRRSFSEEPKYLGQGVDGMAFSVGDSVLKIFGDEQSYQHAKAAYHRLHNKSNYASVEANIYDVDELGVFNNQPIYYSLMEKLKPITKSFDEDGVYDINMGLRVIIDAVIKVIPEAEASHIREQLENNENNVKIGHDIKRFVSLIEKYVEFQYYKIERIEELMPNLNKNWLNKLIEEIVVKYLTGRVDLHMGNIGLTNNGFLRYFDSSHSSIGNDTINY